MLVFFIRRHISYNTQKVSQFNKLQRKHLEISILSSRTIEIYTTKESVSLQ